MKYKTFTPRFFVALSVILVAAVLRLLPHWPNLTPIAAMALFAGTYIDKKQYAFAIPIAAMFISDLFIGLHSNIPAVYLGFAITVLIGMAIRKRVNVGTVLFASVGSSVIFFLITNFSRMAGEPVLSANIRRLTGMLYCGASIFPGLFTWIFIPCE